MKKIFLSYSWYNTEIANEIDNDFKSLGVILIRDVRDAENYRLLTDFMKRIRECDFALLLISDNYLKSENCMYELIEYSKERDFDEKIIPIVLDDAKKVRNLSGQIEYIQYWEDRLCVSVNGIKNIDPLNSTEQIKQVEKTREISQKIGSFLNILKYKKTIEFDELKKTQYRSLFKFIKLDNPNVSEEIIKIINIKDSQEQEIAFNKHKETYGESDVYCNARGNVYYFKTEYKTALFYYEKALILKPDNAYIHNNIANVLSDIGHYLEAKKEYEISIKQAPNFAEAYDNLGNLLSSDYFKEYDNARENHETALKLNPSNAGIHMNYANLMYNVFKDNNKAKNHYKKAIEINPKFTLAYLGIADLLLEEDDINGAYAHYMQALELEPDNAYIHEKFANFLIKSTIKFNENNAMGYPIKLETYENYNDARAHLEKALEINPNDDDNHTNLGNLLSSGNFKDYFGAKMHYEKALKINPNNAYAHENLALLLKNEFYKDYEEAKEHFVIAINLIPNFAGFHYNYANFLAYEIKDNESAWKEYEIVFKICYEMMLNNESKSDNVFAFSRS